MEMSIAIMQQALGNAVNAGADPAESIEIKTLSGQVLAIVKIHQNNGDQDMMPLDNREPNKLQIIVQDPA